MQDDETEIQQQCKFESIWNHQFRLRRKIGRRENRSFWLSYGSHAFRSSDRRSLRPHDAGAAANGAHMVQNIIAEGFDIVQPFRSGQPPESDTCRQLLEGKLWAKTNLTIGMRQALGFYTTSTPPPSGGSSGGGG